MVDWSTAQRIAGLVAGTPPSGSLPGDIVELADDAAERIGRYTGMQPTRALPPPEAVDRREWIGANLSTMKPLIEPLADRLSVGMGPLAPAMRSLSSLLLGAQVGAITGLLSQRVLGQYDLSLMEPDREARLLLLTPNLHEAARSLDVDQRELVHWVTVHEVTHAVQFSSVGWLRGHVAGLLEQLLQSMQVSLDPRALRRLPSADDLRGLLEAVRKGNLLTVFLGPERRVLLDRIQATMSLIEGHAEHVMDAVGAQLLPDLPRLRRSLDRRRGERTPAWRILERLLGIDLKLRQYELGRAFCDEVVDRGGVAALARAWERPESLPTLEELADPDLWLRRTNVPAVTSS